MICAQHFLTNSKKNKKIVDSSAAFLIVYRLQYMIFFISAIYSFLSVRETLNFMFIVYRRFEIENRLRYRRVL